MAKIYATRIYKDNESIMCSINDNNGISIPYTIKSVLNRK